MTKKVIAVVNNESSNKSITHEKSNSSENW